MKKINTCGPTASMKHEILSKLRENQVGPPISTNVEDSLLMAETVLTQNSKKLLIQCQERYGRTGKDKIEKNNLAKTRQKNHN